MAIRFYLAPHERDILLERVPQLDESVRTRLSLGVVEDGELAFDFTEALFREFIDTVEFVVATTDDKALLPILMMLYNACEDDSVSDSASWGELCDAEDRDEYDDKDDYDAEDLTSEMRLLGVREDITKELLRLLNERNPETLEEVRTLFLEAVMRRNRKPMKELGGLTPEHMMRMLHIDWKSPESAMTLHEDIPPELLQNSNMLDDAMLFLRMMRERNGVKATARGNLPRKFVMEIRPQLKDPRAHLTAFRASRKYWNEDDVFPLLVLRHLLTLSGLLRKTKGVFKITRKGERMLAPDKAGALLTTLFHTYYRKFNVAFVDRLPECPSLQFAVVYSLFMLKRYAADWITVETVGPRLFPSFVMEEFASESVGLEPNWHIFARTRLLSPLTQFGLIEGADLNSFLQSYNLDSKVRITPLFDAMIEFHV